MQIQNIQGVISQLGQIVQQCMATRSRAGYFAALYKRMTEAVEAGIIANKFEDGPRMERLDMVFAQRYLDAYRAHGLQQNCSLSWQFTLDACADDAHIVLQHILLGVNTHINLDLAIAAATIAPGNSIYAMEKDFYYINQLISSLLDDVQECLSQVWPPMRVLAKIANGQQDAVINFSVDKARTTSWANAVMLANMTKTQQNAYILQMDRLVRNIGEKIKSPGFGTKLMLRAIRATEFDDVARTIKLIDTTVVD